MLVKHKVTLTELAERVGVTVTNLSISSTGCLSLREQARPTTRFEHCHKDRCLGELRSGEDARPARESARIGVQSRLVERC